MASPLPSLAALLATPITYEAMEPQVLAVLRQSGVSERSAKAALRLTGRARPRQPNQFLGPATAALRRSEPLVRATYLLSAAQRLEQGLHTEGVGYSGALRAEERFYAQHRRALTGRDRAAAVADDMAREHGPILGWKALPGAESQCRRLHGTNFDVRKPPMIDGRPSLPGMGHGAACRCEATAPWSRRGRRPIRQVTEAELSGTAA